MKHPTQYCEDCGDCGLWTVETQKFNSEDPLWERPEKRRRKKKEKRKKKKSAGLPHLKINRTLNQKS